MQEGLCRWLRTRAPRHAEDLAAEAVTLALQRFSSVPADWDEVRAWCAGVARRLVVEEWRRQQRQRCDASAVLEQLPALVRESGVTREVVVAFAVDLRGQLSAGDGATLDLLLGGVTDNREIASWRRCTVRSVEASRARIGRVARAWILARPLRARTMFSMRAASLETRAAIERLTPSRENTAC